VGIYRRVLIVRACAIGDFVLNLPALRALAVRDPHSRFTLVGYPEVLSLAKDFIPIEAIFSIESPPWSKLFVGPVPHLGFDQAWVWMKDSTLADHLRESGIGEVIHANALPESMHAADHLLVTAGLSAPELPDLWLPESDRVIIHPGSGSPAKCWPWFRELADEIPDSVVLLGPCESQIQTNRLRLEGLKLEFVAKELRSCRAFIGNDSGITHLAAYLGCPTIALFGPTDPRIWGPIGRRVAILRGTPLSTISVEDIRKLYERIEAGRYDARGIQAMGTSIHRLGK
jgi:heptosyltransferase-3